MKKYNIIKNVVLKQTVSRLEKKALYLGKNENYAYKYLYYRFILSIIVIFLALIFSSKYIIYILLLVIFIYIISEFIIFDLRIKRRRQRIEKEAIYYFDFLIIVLNEEEDLEKAMMICCEEIESEFSKIIKENLNKYSIENDFKKIIDNLKKYFPSSEIWQILNILKQNSSLKEIAINIKEQLEYLKNRTKFDLKIKQKQIPYIICLISLIFYTIFILIIIYGPAFINNFPK